MEVVVGGLETCVRARPVSVEDLVYWITRTYYETPESFLDQAHALAATYFSTRQGTHYALRKYTDDAELPDEVRRFCWIATL